MNPWEDVVIAGSGLIVLIVLVILIRSSAKDED